MRLQADKLLSPLEHKFSLYLEMGEYEGLQHFVNMEFHRFGTGFHA